MAASDSRAGSQPRFLQEDPPRLRNESASERKFVDANSDEDDQLDFGIGGNAFGKPSALLASVLDDVNIADSYAENDNDIDFNHDSNLGGTTNSAAVELSQQRRTVFIECSNHFNGNTESQREEMLQEEKAFVIPQLQRWIMVTEEEEQQQQQPQDSSVRSQSEIGGSRSVASAHMNFLFGASDNVAHSGSRRRSSAGDAATPGGARGGAGMEDPLSASRSDIKSASSSCSHLHAPVPSAAASSLSSSRRFRGVQQRKDDMLTLLADLAAVCERNSLHHYQEQRQQQREKREEEEEAAAAAAGGEGASVPETAALKRQQARKRAVIASFKDAFGL